MKKIFLSFLFFQLFTNVLSAQIITTIAGGDTSLGDGGPALDGQLAAPIGIAMDNVGNIYVADRDHNRIRKINTSGIITTVAGTGVAGYSGDGGNATSAEIRFPYGVAVDLAGNILFCDEGNNRVRRVNASGIITTIVGTGIAGFSGDGGPAVNAQLNLPCGIAVDASGDIYVVDCYNNRVRKIDATGTINTIAGSGLADHSGNGGPAILGGLNQPYCVAVDGSGNIYVGEDYGSSIRKINTSGVISTIAGSSYGLHGYAGDGGLASTALFNRVAGLACDAFGNIFVSDYGNFRIRKISAEGTVSTIAGTGVMGYLGDGGEATTAKLDGPVGIVLTHDNAIVFCDFNSATIRSISAPTEVQQYNQLKGMSVFPNPANDFVTITLPSTVSHAKVVITDVLGKTVLERTVMDIDRLTFDINLSPGIYIVTTYSDTDFYSTKLFVD